MQQPCSPKPNRKATEPKTDQKKSKKRKQEEVDPPSEQCDTFKTPIYFGSEEGDVNSNELLKIVTDKKPLNGYAVVCSGQLTRPDEDVLAEMEEVDRTVYLAGLGKNLFQEVVEAAGGTFRTAVSGKTHFLVLGHKPGLTKISAVRKANEKKPDGEHVAVVDFRTFVDLCMNSGDLAGQSLLEKARKVEFQSRHMELSDVDNALQNREAHATTRRRLLDVERSIRHSQQAASASGEKA